MIMVFGFDHSEEQLNNTHNKQDHHNKDHSEEQLNRLLFPLPVEDGLDTSPPSTYGPRIYEDKILFQLTLFQPTGS